VLTISTTDTGTAYVLEFTAEQETRPAVVSGPQVVAGAQLAHTYRFTDPVRGFQTVGPVDVKLFGGGDYARNESWPTYDSGVDGWAGSSTTGTQELRGTPGLVRMTSTLAFNTYFTNKQLAANAMLGDTDGWIASIYTAFTTGYVGGYPAEMSDLIASLTTFYAAYVAETDPAVKIERAEGIVDTAYILLSWARYYESLVPSGQSYAFVRQEWDNYVSGAEDAITDPGNTYLTLTTEYTTYMKLAANRPETNWVRPWVDYYRLFTQGVHSAAVTLYNGAFDPLWYAQQADYLYNEPGSSAGGPLRADSFVLPGKTGFLIPLNPPHGASLSSFAINLSFRAHTENNWGIYRDLPIELEQLGRNNPDTINYEEVSRDTAWDPLQGVLVELWRFNTVDFGVSEDQWAAWEEHQPEAGFGERIAQWTIDLSEVSPPADEANTVTEAWRNVGLFGEVDKDIYVGKEHFEKRVWDLVQYFGSADARARVDRRHYTYFAVVRFFGGMRATRGGYYVPFVRGDAATDKAADPRWELPQAITRSTGEEDRPTTSGQIYGHFDNAYNVQDSSTDSGSETNAPWNTLSFPPQVKFRGARLGWTTDRAGDGGW